MRHDAQLIPAKLTQAATSQFCYDECGLENILGQIQHNSKIFDRGPGPHMEVSSAPEENPADRSPLPPASRNQPITNHGCQMPDVRFADDQRTVPCDQQETLAEHEVGFVERQLPMRQPSPIEDLSAASNRPMRS